MSDECQHYATVYIVMHIQLSFRVSV